MAYELDLIRQLHPFYWKNNIYFFIYLACLVVLFLFRKKEGWKKGYRAIFWYSIVAMILICYNPLFTKLTFERLFWYDMSTYVRVFLLLPVLLTAAYVLTGVICMLPRIAGDIVLAVVAVIMLLFGETASDHDMYMAADNPYKINIQAVQICDMIDKELEDGERCVLYAPPRYDEVYGTDLVTQGIRQYDSDIILYRTFPVEITEEEFENGSFEEYLDSLETAEQKTYLLCLPDQKVIDKMEELGYRCVGNTDNFFLMTRDEAG